MGRKPFYAASGASARILGSIEIKWGISFNEIDWNTLGIVSVSQETQSIKSMAYFPDSIYLDPYHPLPSISSLTPL